MSERLLFSTDIAAMRNISRWQARRWLEALEAEYGSAVVGQVRFRQKVRRYTTEAALARVGPRATNAETRLLNAVADLARRVEVLEEKIAAR